MFLYMKSLNFKTTETITIKLPHIPIENIFMLFLNTIDRAMIELLGSSRQCLNKQS